MRGWASHRRWRRIVKRADRLERERAFRRSAFKAARDLSRVTGKPFLRHCPTCTCPPREFKP